MKIAWMVIAAIALACVARCACDKPREPSTFATFNIEDFPKSARQVAGAFDEIAKLHSGVIAVQEIRDPAVFEREAKRRFGERWAFVYVNTQPVGEERPGHNNGVLYDGARWKLLDTRVFDGTRLVGGRHKPVFDVRLQQRGGSVIVHVLVLHFKAKTEGRPVRHAQFAALRDIVVEVQRAREPIIVMGDFNATERGDRDDLAELAKATGLVWASEPLACTEFWNREDGCPRSRLDHVLTWTSPREIHVGGACATEGCDWQPSCPLYAHEVSDHCPVVVTLP